MEAEQWRFAESLKSVSEDTAQEYEGRTILELVQNGHDALGDAGPGRIAVLAVSQESGGVLYVANEGTAFAEENFRAITELALSSKAAGEGIGNKGLGFRSVLQLTDWPEIHSKSSPASLVFDGYCFGFARPEDVRTLVDDPALATRVGTDSATTGRVGGGYGFGRRVMPAERCCHLGCLLRALASATRALSSSAGARVRRWSGSASHSRPPASGRSWMYGPTWPMTRPTRSRTLSWTAAPTVGIPSASSVTRRSPS
ncbi:sacsin N-terminal ATP-binding-like domain-containing protein [Streptomyces sp. NBC_01235]|uniref:sacsin N-terminal ATP-binding-like domain-containing protein n=1 Tax=Streptomyces sp. NBC_01235 TaxID=2903788 RepID=UPI002E13EA12